VEGALEGAECFASKTHARGQEADNTSDQKTKFTARFCAADAMSVA
jgi:hypothetical protein